jgi:hypothetical protein
MIVVYHVFTDSRDLWTENYRFARKIYTHWKKTRDSARLYKEVYENEEGMLSDEMIEEDCLMSHGYYPS